MSVNRSPEKIFKESSTATVPMAIHLLTLAGELRP